MAWMTKDGKGPYPCDAGEYCGNHLPGGKACARFNQTHEEPQYNQDQWLARMRFGRPHSCKEGTSAEMSAKGWVGLYLKESDGPLVSGATHVETPDELREPDEPEALAAKGDTDAEA